MYKYVKKLIHKTRKHIRKTGTLRGSGLGEGLLCGIFAYFV